jgi:flagellar biogenesis protein FliO
MTSSELLLVSVSSSLVTVVAMVLVGLWLRRRRLGRDTAGSPEDREGT